MHEYLCIKLFQYLRARSVVSSKQSPAINWHISVFETSCSDVTSLADKETFQAIPLQDVCKNVRFKIVESL